MGGAKRILRLNLRALKSKDMKFNTSARAEILEDKHII